MFIISLKLINDRGKFTYSRVSSAQFLHKVTNYGASSEVRAHYSVVRFCKASLLTIKGRIVASVFLNKKKKKERKKKENERNIGTKKNTKKKMQKRKRKRKQSEK